MIEKLRSFAGNPEWIANLFALLILSFPFGSYLLSFSIGFMTVYPYLVLLVLLSFLAFWMPRPAMSGITRFYLLFMVIFFLFSLCFLPFVEGRAYAITDVRSIALMLMTTWVFIAVRQFLGFSGWRDIILQTFKLIFLVVSAFALLEILTGWHVTGEFTEKIMYRGMEDKIIHMPVFLWDNPNNLVAYMLLLACVILLLEPVGAAKGYLVAMLLTLLFVIAVQAEARLAELALVIVGAIYFGNRLLMSPCLREKRALLYTTFLVAASGYAVLTHGLFTEIPAGKAMRIEKVGHIYPVPASVRNFTNHHAARQVPASQPNRMNYRNSASERLALILNGLDFVREHPLTGVGPGQYRYRHDKGTVNHYTFGNNGAHFWLVELISQYGIIMFGLYLSVLAWIVVRLVRYFRLDREMAVGLLIGLVALAAASVLPSAFLILDINWIFTVILVVAAGELAVGKTAQAHD